MTWQNLISRISGQFSRVSTADKHSSTIDDTKILNFLNGLAPNPSVSDWFPAKNVAGINVQNGKVLVALSVPPEHAEALEQTRKAIEDELSAMTDVVSAQVILTAESSCTDNKDAPKPAQQPKKIGQHATGKAIELPGVKQVIAVASGKGGVGKSTTTANLAIALSQQGLKVGVLDADIYGPSLPTLFGCQGQKPGGNADGQILPIDIFDLKIMSIGFMVKPDAAMIWRGPMASGAIEQLFRDVEWGELDVLLVDMPPGTGDIQITMAQKAPLDGAVVVSTPQDLALIDAKRAVTMFDKVKIPVYGFVENMSYYQCPNCGHKEHIFDHGGAENAAKDCDVQFLGAVPLNLAIREAADNGTPITKAQPDSPQAQAYLNIAEKLCAEPMKSIG